MSKGRALGGRTSAGLTGRLAVAVKAKPPDPESPGREAPVLILLIRWTSSSSSSSQEVRDSGSSLFRSAALEGPAGRLAVEVKARPPGLEDSKRTRLRPRRREERPRHHHSCPRYQNPRHYSRTPKLMGPSSRRRLGPEPRPAIPTWLP
ncbi:hypothetical protein Nepgr_030370 [Nepenthes gracilis]|uniref:Uncharacterized protein n=1 Tax=Nepenthes gracilis TaxID=150966 RepID=A0AAD3Y3U1_NEPGR|nr:hypothetical protein Nepgr_030370 [Nepenthes gracilis]